MLNNLLDMAIPNLPIIILSQLDDPLVIFILGAVGAMALATVITVFYVISKKRKRNAKKTPSNPETNLNDEGGEK